MISATLFVRPECHLCEDALAELGRLRRRYPHTLTVVDITGDADLLNRFQIRIPVLQVGSREYDAPLDAAKLRRALVDGAA